MKPFTAQNAEGEDMQNNVFVLVFCNKWSHNFREDNLQKFEKNC